MLATPWSRGAFVGGAQVWTCPGGRYADPVLGTYKQKAACGLLADWTLDVLRSSFGPVGGADLDLWLVDLQATHGDEKELWSWLDASERRRAEKLRTPDLRRRFIRAHAAVRATLAHELGTAPREIAFGAGPCVVCGAPHGKPFIAAPKTSLEFSISRSGTIVLIAAAAGSPVGVDVQEIGSARDVDGLEDNILSEATAAWLRALPEEERCRRFYALWTGTEAILKAAGTGLAGDVRAAGVAALAGLSRHGVVEHADSHWAVSSVTPAPGYVAAVAVAARPTKHTA
jgi:4'-phosphopantetheinyl transferase